MAQHILFRDIEHCVPEIKQLQEALWAAGAVGPDNQFWKSSVARRNKITSCENPKAKGFWIDGDFGEWTEEAVKHAQLRLLGPDKYPLDEIVKLGVVDLDTHWALSHPQPRYQTQDIPAAKVGFGQVKFHLGVAVVKIWDHYIDLKVHEIPNGSNRGPWVDPYWPGVKHGGIDAWINYNPRKPKVKGPAWCCFSRCRIEYEARGLVAGKAGYFQSKGRTGLCYANYKWATQQDESILIDAYKAVGINIDPSWLRGWVVDKKWVLEGKVPLPTGTNGIMNYGGTRGHTMTVAGVINGKSGKPSHIVTREGNVSNKVDRRKRSINQGSLKWFVISPELLKNPDFNGVFGRSTKTATGKERTR